MLLVRRVAGESMLPKLRPGRLVLAVKKQPKVGNVVIAQVEGREVIKRLDHIKNQQVFLTGDNPGRSTDSRSYGYLPKPVILGVVVLPKNL